MNKSTRIFEILKSKIHSKEFIEESKQSEKAFRRHRLMPFPVIFLLILNLIR